MAAIIQRIESAQAKGTGEDMFDPAELTALLEQSEEIANEVEDKQEDKEE